MIVTSGALVLVALVLLVMGVLGADLPYVYASIAVSTLSLLCLLVGILQRRGEPLPDGDDLVPVQVPASTSVRTGSTAVDDPQDDPARTSTLSQDLLSRGRADDPDADAGAAQEQGWQGGLTDDAPRPHEDEQRQDEDELGPDEHHEDSYEDEQDSYEDEDEDGYDEGADQDDALPGEPSQDGARLVRVPQQQAEVDEADEAEQPDETDDAEEADEADDADEADAADRTQEADDASPVGTVLIVPGRPRYHTDGCRYLYGKQPQSLDVDDARHSGFVACGVCKPDAVLAAPADAEELQQQAGAPQDDDPQEQDHLSLEESLFGEAVFGAAASADEAPVTGDDAPRPVEAAPDSDARQDQPAVAAVAPDQVAPTPDAAEQAAPAGRDVASDDRPDAPAVEPSPAGSGPDGTGPADTATVPEVPATASADRTPGGKAPGGKAPAKKAPAEKAPGGKAPAKKAAARERVAEKAPGKKAPGKKAPGRKAPARRGLGEKAPVEASTADPAAPLTGPPSNAPTPAAPASDAPAPSTSAVRRIRATAAAPVRAPGAVPTVRRISATGAARPATAAARPTAAASGGPTTTAAAPARTSATPREAVPARRAGQVVVVPDRTRFHRPQCRFVRDVPGATALSRAAADRQGYEACGVCKP